MRFESHIFRYCLTCKHFDPKKATEIQVFCEKQNGEPVNNYQAQKCTANKYFESCRPLQ